jgi:hypothetical protein
MSIGRVAGRRFRAGVTLALLAAGAAACGGGGGPTAPTTPSTVTNALPTWTFSGVEADAVASTDVIIGGPVVLTCTADWGSASNDIDIYVTATSCVAGDVDGLLGCPFVSRTTAVSTKPERLAVDVAPGNYRVWVANFGPGAESGTLQLTVTFSQ